MSFLAPWFFAGAAAVALPIIFHLVRQSIRKKKMFSSLMFLKPTPPKIKRRNRLENILLLLLRCALLILLAAAFTRPFFKQAGDTPQGDASNEIVAVLIDTSASMQRGSVWEEAVELASDSLSELEDFSNVALLAFDRQTRTMLSFDEWGRAEPNQRSTLWKERMSVLEPSHAGTSLGNAMVSAAELLEDARSRNETSSEPPRGRLIVITDLQEGANLDGLAGFNWPKRVTVEILTPDYRSQSNAGIHPVASDPNAVLTAVQTNTSRIFLSNAEDSNTEQFEVAWIDERNRRLHEPEPIYLPPGRSGVRKMPALTNSTASRIELTGDDEPFDNIIHIVPETPQEIQVASVGAGDPTDPRNLSFFLRSVFQSTTRQIMRYTNYTDPRMISADTPIDLLVTTDDPLARAAAQLQLERGHSVLLILEENATGALLGELLNTGVMSIAEGQERNYAMFGKIEFEHPVFAPFLDARFSDFTGIQIWKYRRLNAESIPDARVLAEFDSEDPALLEIPMSGASLFVLTTSWKPDDSRLALSSKFVPLLYSFLEMNRPPLIEGQSLVVGDTVATATDETNLTLKTPNGNTLNDISPTTIFDKPGIYSLETPDKPARMIAVNLHPAESRTSTLPVENLIRIGVPIRGVDEKAESIQLAREIQQKDADTEAQQKNWRWLLAAAVGIFLLESWLSGRSHSSVQAETSSA